MCGKKSCYLVKNDIDMYMNILFNGGAVWGFCEYIGSLQYIREHKLDFDRVYGVSAGSGIAALYVLGFEIDEILDMWNAALAKTKLNSSLTENHIIGCRFLFDNRPDAYKIANDRLFIGISGANGFFWKSKFTSNEDLGNALICGGTIPLLSSYDAFCDTKISIDGGIYILPSDVPENTRIIRPTTPFPLSVIPPAPFIQHILQAIGYYNMRTISNEISFMEINPLLIQILFVIQQYQPKQYNVKMI
jgi:predicted acylesterase/phospholipase RssA